MGAVIGIDLGTTNTVVATLRDGRAVALPDESGATLIPSIVSFLPSGAVLVGNAARERRADDVRNTIYSVKRLIGRTWDSPEVTQARNRFPFELREGPGRATFVIARGETYTLPEISAFVLRKAKSIAELELGEPVDRAVITVPANFNDLQRAATKVAGRVAGLEVLRIINEPTAAALAFGHTPGKTKLLAVYDFGGGTFDFTVLRLTSDVFEVLATAGNTFLGGDDVDSDIAERMADRFIAEEKPDPRETPDGLERLRSAAEHIKVVLSSEPDATVRLSELGIVGAPNVDFLLTRRDLDSCLRPVVEKTFAVCRDALSSAKVSPKDIDDVLLVGGSTKDSYVRKRVGEFFGKPARFDVDPHEVVALGAAQHAAMLTRTGAKTAEVAVPPPPQPQLQPQPAPPSSALGAAQVGDFRQKTQPFEHSAPSTPQTRSAPTTRDTALRDRRTTGLGLGPKGAPGPDVLPLVGVGTHSPVQPLQVTPTPLDATQPPSTLSGLGPKALASTAATNQIDAELPATKIAGTATGTGPLARGPAMRVPAGQGAPPKPSLDLADTLASALVRADLPNQKTKEPLAGSPAIRRPDAKISRPDPLGPTVASPPIATHASTAHNVGERELPTNRDTLPDDDQLPVLSSPQPTSARGLFPRFDTPLSPEHPAQLSPELGDDEPTVARRNQPDLDELLANAHVNSAPAATHPPVSQLESRAKRPTSLNEEEIFARYGNLPLIVGGKRVGGPAPAPLVAEPKPATTAAKAPTAFANPLERPTPNLEPLARQRTQVIAPEPKLASTRPISLEPEALELEAIPLEQGGDTPASNLRRPVPGRFSSSHPAARQDFEMEAELPVPDLPPSSNRGNFAPFSVTTPASKSSVEPVAAVATPTVAQAVRSPQATQPAFAPIPPPSSSATPPLAANPRLPQSHNASTQPVGRVATEVLPLQGFVTTGNADVNDRLRNTSTSFGSPTASPLNPQTVPSRRPPGPALLIDVTPLSLCVETAGGYSDVLVARNTPVPCERTRDFVTVMDNQETVIVRVSQGESPQFHENVLLGEVQLSKLPLAPRGQTRISVTFGLDSDGMLHVRALDIASGQSAVSELQLVAAPSSPEVRQMIARQKTKGTLGTSN